MTVMEGLEGIQGKHFDEPQVGKRCGNQHSQPASTDCVALCHILLRPLRLCPMRAHIHECRSSLLSD